MRFLTASRTMDELSAAKTALNEIFLDAVQGPKKTYNPRGVQVLHENRMEIAQLFVQIVTDEIAVTDPTPFFVDTDTIGYTDDYMEQELDGTLKVVKRSYGSKPTTQRLTWKERGLTTSMKEIGVGIPLEELAGGRFSASQLAEEMAQAVNRHRIAAIIDGVDAAVPAAADRTGKAGYTLRYSGLTKANLDKALDGMLDESESPVILGRHTALYPAIREFAGWSEQTLTEFERRGVLGSYLGAPINVLRDTHSKRYGGHFLRNDRVYIASGRKGIKFISKDVSFLNWAETSEKYAAFETGIRIEDGLVVRDPYLYRIIEIA